MYASRGKSCLAFADQNVNSALPTRCVAPFPGSKANKKREGAYTKQPSAPLLPLVGDTRCPALVRSALPS
jgi:hypothetical protein